MYYIIGQFCLPAILIISSRKVWLCDGKLKRRFKLLFNQINIKIRFNFGPLSDLTLAFIQLTYSEISIS